MLHSVVRVEGARLERASSLYRESEAARDVR
jgi:hypothetical protein